MAGIVVGIIVAIAGIWITDVITQQFYPLPAPEARPADAVAWVPPEIPAGALLFVAFAWFIGALLGGGAAGLISGKRWTVWLLAALVLVAATILTAWLPAPGWAKMGAVIAPMLGGLIATALTALSRPQRRTRRAEPASAPQ
ncbi:MAG: hypothetical protein ACK4K7_05225 [Allosphingosinicella sp.]|uniref:hypothetical protein n=1 Tax=Allosphingosinicella sp. TaxID=2823234 RepID=UPI00392E66E9